MFLLCVLYFTPQITTANGDSTKTNQELTTTANVYINSSNSEVGEVKRWENIGQQTLLNVNTMLYETIREFPKSKYPTVIKWYTKEVKVAATIQAVFKPVRSVSFRADVRVNGRFTSDDDPQTINEPLTMLDSQFSDHIWIDTPVGPRYKARGHQATVIAYAPSQTYTLTRPMTVSVYADGEGMLFQELVEVLCGV